VRYHQKFIYNTVVEGINLNLLYKYASNCVIEDEKKPFREEGRYPGIEKFRVHKKSVGVDIIKKTQKNASLFEFQQII